MINCVVVSPEELYALGKILNAKYIDYAYVAAVKDLGVNVDIFMKDTLGSLVSKGLLDEDFSGDVRPTEETNNLFMPVFFNDFETTLDVCTVKETSQIKTMKFHFLKDNITKIEGISDGFFKVGIIKIEDLGEIINSIIPTDPDEGNDVSEIEFVKDDVSRFIVAKSNRITLRSVVATYMEANGRLYKEDENGTVICINKDDCRNELEKVLKGVM